MRPKKAAQHRHAKRRAAERHGMNLNKFDLKSARSQIQSGQAKFIERKSLRVTVWVVALQGKEVPVLYDKKSHSIVTVLPTDARELGITEMDVRA